MTWLKFWIIVVSKLATIVFALHLFIAIYFQTCTPITPLIFPIHPNISETKHGNYNAGSTFELITRLVIFVCLPVTIYPTFVLVIQIFFPKFWLSSSGSLRTFLISFALMFFVTTDTFATLNSFCVQGTYLFYFFFGIVCGYIGIFTTLQILLFQLIQSNTSEEDTATFSTVEIEYNSPQTIPYAQQCE